MKKKYCKKCKIHVKGSECPICKGTDLTENFQGRIFVTDPEKSDIAKKIGIKLKGDYAIKVR